MEKKIRPGQASRWLWFTICHAITICPKTITLLDDRQITHLIGVRLKHLLYDFLGGVLGLFPVVFLYKVPKTVKA